MAVKSTKSVIHISLDNEILDSLNLVVKTLRKKGIKITKSSLLSSLFVSWMVDCNMEYEKIKKGEEKKNA